MKKTIATAVTLMSLTGVLLFGETAYAQNNGQYVVGVPVYDLSDDQVLSFREYLENYIGVQFEDVSFLYSQSIHSAEEEMDFIQNCIDNGADGIMAFNSFDLEAEVALCAENGVYYMKPSSTPSEEEFAAVEDNPYFLGYFGPGTDMEYESGADMAKWFSEQDYGNRYLVFSGGACMGNAMHRERTKGILDTLAAAYGVEFDISTDELACVSDSTTVTAGDLTVTVCGGYIATDPFLSAAKEVLADVEADVVLSVIPPGALLDDIKDVKLGIIDCYTETNSDLYAHGRLQYLCGKYSSIIGPAFASMYNAMTGYAEDFREDGKAFSIIQGFWTSDSEEDFNKKYELSSGIAINAYSYHDILQVIKAYNPDVTLDDLKKLGEGWDYESALDRVNNEK